MTDPVRFAVPVVILAYVVMAIIGVMVYVGFSAILAVSRAEYRGWKRGFADAQEIWKAGCERYQARCEAAEAMVARLNGQLGEAREMARKPLTATQLDACKAANGMECPRCGNEDEGEMSIEDIVIDEDDPTSAFRDIQCSECQEQWRLVFRLNLEKVEPAED